MRVLVMASTFPRWQGDTEPSFVYNLSDRLAKKFDEVVVLAPHAPLSLTNEVWDGVRIVRFRYFWPEKFQQLAYGGILPNLKRNPLLWLLVPFFVAAEFFAAFRLSMSNDFDVIHAHWVFPQGIIAILVGKFSRTPVLITSHAADIYGVRGTIQDRLKRWALNSSSYFTTVSQDLMDKVMALRPKQNFRASVISMGVDTNNFHPSKQDVTIRERLGIDGPMILFVGRLAEKKGVRYLLEAMPDVLRQSPDAALVIVGNGPLRSEMEALVSKLDIESSVRFVGAVNHDHLPAYYATADVFVGPSIVAAGGDTEGVPTTLMEALASGCPVVASDVGGVKDVILHNRTGITVPERDPKAIANGIQTIIADPSVQQRLRDGGIQWARECFDQQVVADKYAEIILELGGSVSVTRYAD